MDLLLSVVDLLLSLARLGGACLALWLLWGWGTGRLVWKDRDRD